ncbi:hypothetical protein TWF281_009505 [Arthrobotrys megalospora]
MGELCNVIWIGANSFVSCALQTERGTPPYLHSRHPSTRLPQTQAGQPEKSYHYRYLLSPPANTGSLSAVLRPLLDCYPSFELSLSHSFQVNC